MINQINGRIIELAEFMKELSKIEQDEKLLIEKLNGLDREVIEQIYTKYNKFPVTRSVNYLKRVTLERLLEGNAITSEWIEQQQKEICKSNKPNSFKVWSISKLYLGFFIPQEMRDLTKNLFQDLMEDIKKSDKKYNGLKTHSREYDNSRNYPTAELWFSFYNKSHKRQTTSKQLFFRITTDSRVQYGLYKHEEIDKSVFVKIQNFKLEDVVAKFKANIEVVLQDEYRKVVKNG